MRSGSTGTFLPIGPALCSKRMAGTSTTRSRTSSIRGVALTTSSTWRAATSCRGCTSSDPARRIQLITNHSELRERGFRALADALGWVNAVRFLREYDPGSGNYTEERSTLLPDLSIEELTEEIARIQEEKGFGTGT